MTLTREMVDRVRRQVEDAGPPASGYQTDEARAALLEQMLQGASSVEEVWIFAYGSLIWSPCFTYAERRIGSLLGYHRRFCLWTKRYRATEERPGLMLAIDRGGSCRGVAFRLTAPDMMDGLRAVWQRELVTAAYMPRWVDVVTDRGPVRAVAFVANRAHERYLGKLPDAEVARRLAHACGHVGPTAEYLFNTVEHLEALGIHDRGLWRLQTLVAAEIEATAAERSAG